MRLAPSLALLLFIASIPASALADGTLVIVSETGDSMGHGTTSTLPFTTGQVSVSQYGKGIRFYNSDANWNLELDPNTEAPIALGCYERATRAPFEDAGRPGVDFSYNGSGCNESTGRYNVLQLNVDQVTGLPTAMAVDFVQHCEGDGPALYGKLRFNSSVPADTNPLQPVFTTTGSLSFTSDPGDYIGGGAPGSYNMDQTTFTASTNYYNGIKASYQTADYSSYWRLGLAAADNMPLTVGTYTSAQRLSFQDAGHPGLDFSRGSRGCNTVTGDFSVSSIDHDLIDGIPTQLTADFTQHCEGQTPALQGHIDFTTTFRNGPLIEDVIYADNFETVRAWPLHWDCE